MWGGGRQTVNAILHKEQHAHKLCATTPCTEHVLAYLIQVGGEVRLRLSALGEFRNLQEQRHEHGVLESRSISSSQMHSGRLKEPNHVVVVGVEELGHIKGDCAFGTTGHSEVLVVA